MMGGVHTDLNGATPVAGLYAAGEVACVSINGANRLGSNSLPELLVFGARAGRAAAAYATEQKPPGRHLLAQALDEEARLQEQFLQKSGGREPIADLREAMQKIMEQCAGIYRAGESLAGAAGKLQQLQERFRDIRLDDRGHLFNTELISALELSCMLEVAETMAECAMQRTESRGAHQRTDYPARNDEKFLAHSLAYRGADGRPRVEYAPVTITRWPPGERVYGK
jgi:fumarate reductase flavoprotein subunit